ncbi:Uncharacterised protein [Pandoraea pulmonicola]|uniref:Uncharacterized protein n=1 Tax=Pandoraea pulmonicola TaxID=93221 RepID=A0AAJ4ZB96_PANPU|nr:Uncharacterised protein [Pandoraea pulmonicola]
MSSHAIKLLKIELLLYRLNETSTDLFGTVVRENCRFTIQGHAEVA